MAPACGLPQVVATPLAAHLPASSRPGAALQDPAQLRPSRTGSPRHVTLSCRQGTAKAALERTCSRLHACLSTRSCSGWSRVLSWEACLSHSEQALTRHAALAGKGSGDQGWFPVAAVRPCPEHSSQRLPCLQRRQSQLDCTVSVEAHDLAQQSHMMVKEAVHPARHLGTHESTTTCSLCCPACNFPQNRQAACAWDPGCREDSSQTLEGSSPKQALT